MHSTEQDFVAGFHTPLEAKMPGKSRNGEKYHRIIAAATKVFARKGFFHAKVSDIAREAQVADGTIYLYFENKDDILISLFEEQMKAVLENMVRQISEEKDAPAKIKRFALTHLRLIELNKNMAEIIQVELRQSSKFMKEYKNEKFMQYLNLIGDIIKDGQEQGVFKRGIIPDIAKRAFFGALDEMSRFWVLSSHRKYDIETAAAQISDYFLHGLNKRPC
jgi:TetR/AcrR family transcriptional regulator, fatty acid metabolism regulator protein